jgi:predicted nucleic acid-binding protein
MQESLRHRIRYSKKLGKDMWKFVWDTSALLNIKEPNEEGYSPGHSLIKDLSDGWLNISYKNIFPAIAYFELQASISRKYREGGQVLREFYILDKHSSVYPITHELIVRSSELIEKPGFDQLRGADLIFACIAYIEDAHLVTLDNHFAKVSSDIRVIDLNESRSYPKYRRHFEGSLV